MMLEYFIRVLMRMLEFLFPALSVSSLPQVHHCDSQTSLLGLLQGLSVQTEGNMPMQIRNALREEIFTSLGQLFLPIKCNGNFRLILSRIVKVKRRQRFRFN